MTNNSSMQMAKYILQNAVDDITCWLFPLTYTREVGTPNTHGAGCYTQQQVFRSPVPFSTPPPPPTSFPMHAREVDTLEAALDSGDDQQLISAVTELQAASATAAASAAVATAAQRSGRRGVAARKV